MSIGAIGIGGWLGQIVSMGFSSRGTSSAPALSQAFWKRSTSALTCRLASIPKALAFFEIVAEPFGRRHLDQMGAFEQLGVELLFRLDGVATVDETPRRDRPGRPAFPPSR